MHRGIYGLLGVAAALGLAVSCKDDPTSTLRGGPALLTLEFDYREVVIRDSVKVTAVVRDGQNNPLPVPITVLIPSSCTAGIASVAPTPAAPLPITAFFLKGLAYGTTCVVAQSSGLSDTMRVATFPARISITGPDTVQSGSTVTFIATYFDALGNPLAGLPAPTWSSTDANVASVTATGDVSGKAPGQVRVEVVGVGSPEAGVTFGRTFVVAPGTFAGTASATTGAPGDSIKYTRGAGAVFDADTRFTYNGLRTFLSGLTADSVKAIVPGIGTTSTVPLLMTSVGPTQIAYRSNFTATTASLDDKYDATNNDPSTAPSITANGDYYIIESGTCSGGANTDPGDDCDDFFRVANPSGVDTLFARVQLDWFSGSDVDILWCRNVTCTSVTTGGGATLSNPEVSNVKIPPGATWYLWLNYFEPIGVTKDILRVRFSGLP
ncbi:MAG TPA: Ig-like domain-containing protein [Gemmatimonadales bacterium]|jgi:hypothetical protein